MTSLSRSLFWVGLLVTSIAPATILGQEQPPEGGKEIYSKLTGGGISGLAISPDGKRIVISSVNDWAPDKPCPLSVLDADTGDTLASIERTAPGVAFGLTFTPDGKHIAWTQSG